MADLSDSLSALSEGIDLGPLGWVKGEIDLAMRQGREALALALADGLDPDPIRRSLGYLHQAHGALSIVGLSAVPVVTAALEGLLQAMAEREALRQPENYTLGLQGFDQIQSYLNMLMTGAAHQPIGLLSLLQALQNIHDQLPLLRSSKKRYSQSEFKGLQYRWTIIRISI
jgi:chemosensory pili system protein ChpA (sensor histidine kinase/response regulator)